MKTIIAGSRTGVYFDDVCDAIEMVDWDITTIISGGANGVDTFGEEIANNLDIPVERYPITKEEWNKYGYAAGPIRNRRMAENAEALIAVWDGKSNGTADMINTARKMGLKVFVHVVGGNVLEEFI
jgi:hypothetical protein